MQTAELLKLLAAKTDRRNSALWLPYYFHAEDVAGVMDFLLAERYAGLYGICGMSAEDFHKTAMLAAYLHDIGKLTPVFQDKLLQSLPVRRGIMEHYQIEIPGYSLNDYKQAPHNVCGKVIALLMLGLPRELASVIGAHHGMPTDAARQHLEGFASCYYGKPKRSEFWESIWREWLDYALTAAGFASADDVPTLNEEVQILLSGLLIMADWLGSNQELFPLKNIDETPMSYPADRLPKALAELNLPAAWQPEQYNMTEEVFKQRFGFVPNAVQQAVVDAVNKCQKPGIFILEAPMGIGKTEAALAAAEVLAKRQNKDGLFFGLPTQATANGIFERTVAWAQQQSQEFYHTIELAHGNAQFMPLFAEMPSEVTVDDSDEDNGLMVHSFFCGRKQACLADFVVGTVDNLLMSALKKKHAMLLHLGLSQKVVIIDECHAYDAYMNEYLDRALTWLGNYEVPVVLLSATLPPKRRAELLQAYLDREGELDCPKNSVYPLLTFSDGGEIRQIELPLAQEEKPVKIECLSAEAALDEAAKAVAVGGCVGIICNTVRTAQQFFKLMQEVPGAKLLLYHAQYIMPDRAEREKEIIAAVGKKSRGEARSGTVVIGTQVLEQSLDLDFDLLLTDLCPVDLLLQRIGRLHRHQRPERPLAGARCIVMGTEEIPASSEAIYSRWLLRQTAQMLPGDISIPADIVPLVTGVYEPEALPLPEDEEALAEYQKRIEDKEQKAQSFLLRKPHAGLGTIDRWLDGNVSENMAQATVRDGISSVEVIVMVRYAENEIGLLPGSGDEQRYNTAICPGEDACKRIAQQKLRLPSVFCQQYCVGKTIEELEKADEDLTGFQRSPWLKGELVLLLDKDLTGHLLNYQLTYSREMGLLYEKEAVE